MLEKLLSRLPYMCALRILHFVNHCWGLAWDLTSRVHPRPRLAWFGWLLYRILPDFDNYSHPDSDVIAW